MGLDFSSATQTVNFNRMYSSGLYFLGVGHSFIKFPKNSRQLVLQDADSIICRTKDGLQVELQARVDYALIPTQENLGALYLMFEDNYEEAYKHLARSTIRDVAATYTAFEFWSARDNITQAMSNQLSDDLDDYFARVEAFLLTNFELPTEFQNAITETDVKKQEVQRMTFLQEQAETEVDTLIKAAQSQVQIIGLQANATAQSIALSAQAAVNKVKTNAEAELRAYQQVKQRLGLTDDELVTYVWMDTINKAKATQKLYNIKSPSRLTF